MFLPPIPAPPLAAVAYPWGSLSLAGELSSFRQSIAFDYVHRAYASPPFTPTHWWVLHRVTQPNPSIRTEDWVDGRTCPGVNEAMRALAATPGPRFSDPFDAEARRLTRRVLDGTDFVLEADAGYPIGAPWRTTRARLRIESNDQGPLAPWFVQLQTATLSCWTAAEPAR